MKKATIRFFLIFCSFLLVLSLQACILGGDTNNPEDNGTDIAQNDNFFSLENFNYNSGYISQTQNEKGFLIFDDIDFNSVIFNSSEISIDSVVFSIWYGGEKLRTMSKNLDDKFSSFRVDKKGEYTIEVNAQKKKYGDAVSGSFKINVSSCGRPDSVRFVITNSKGQTVENVKGGDTYTFSAKIYSDEKEITVPEESFYWGKVANVGIKECQYSIGNTVREQVKPFDFYCFVKNNSGENVNIVNQTFTEVDNLVKTEQFPEGVYYSYGVETNTHRINLDVNAANTPNSTYFYDGITAEYRFDNGDISVLTLSDKIEEGKFSVLVSYDNKNYAVYDVKKYDYSIDNSGKKIVNYFGNGVKYQFDPTQNEAKIYLAVWAKTKTEYGFSTVQEKVESSILDIGIVKDEPSTFKVNSVSGSHKKDLAPYSTDFSSFNKTIINNSFQVYVCCDMNGNGKISDEYEGKTLSEINQYFVLNLDANYGSLWDYTIDYIYTGLNSAIELRKVEYQALGTYDRYFVCPNVGTAYINVRSRFSDKVINLTVNVIDKVFDSERIIDYSDTTSYWVFAKVDFRTFISIKEIRLSSHAKKNFYLRNLRENEELEYLSGLTVKAPDAFSSEDNGNNGQNVTIRIKNTTVQREINRVYIIPNFEFTINGNQCTMDGSVEIVSKTVFSVLGSTPSSHFYGYIPTMEYTAAENEIVDYNSLSLINVQAETITTPQNDIWPRFSQKINGNVLTVEYLFSYGVGNKMVIYKVEIAKIYVK